MAKVNIVEQLKKHLASMTPEEKQKEWDELKHWNNVGPTVKEYLKDLKARGLYNENK